MTKQTIKEQILHFMESQKKKSFSMEEIAQGLNLEKSSDFNANHCTNGTRKVS